MIFVQSVGDSLPLLHLLLQRVDQAVQKRPADTNTVLFNNPTGLRGKQSNMFLTDKRSHGELAELGLDAAVPHAHPGESRPDVPGSS